MFNKKQTGNKEEIKLKTTVDQDLIVHNMPHRSRFSTAPLARKTANSQSKNEFLSASTKASSNFKMVGGLIIGLGIIFIATLAYLSYRFVIKPQAEPRIAPVQEQVLVSETFVPNLDLEQIAVSTSTEIEGAEASVVGATTDQEEDISSNGAEVFMPEEGVVLPENSWLPVLDTDADGLTDEEEAVLSTNPNEIDTDQDGYLDLAEVKNGYDPNGPGRLADNNKILRYRGEVGRYSLLHPSVWNVRTINNGYTALISAPDNSLMQVSVQENPRIQDIASWYQETFPQETPAYDRIKNGQGWEGIIGESGLNFYLTDQTRQNIYVISYIPAISGRLAYPNIFQMIIDSFQLD